MVPAADPTIVTPVGVPLVPAGTDTVTRSRLWLVVAVKLTVYVVPLTPASGFDSDRSTPLRDAARASGAASPEARSARIARRALTVPKTLGRICLTRA